MNYIIRCQYARCNEGMHNDTKLNTPSMCIRYFGPSLNAFLGHLLAAAHQGNAAGIFRFYCASAGFGYLHFKAASLTKKQITFLHVTIICPGETSFGCYLRAIDYPLQRFSFRFTFFAIFTDSVDADFHFVNSAGVSLPQRFGVNHQTLRA